MSKKIKPSKGDRIKHEKFGTGTVVDVADTDIKGFVSVKVKIDNHHDLFVGGVLSFYYSPDIGHYPRIETIAPAKKLTQHDYIALHLAKGESISNKNAYEFCGTMKLSTRIGEIEKAHNVAFKRTPEQHTLKCNGRKGNHTVYSLDGALGDQSIEFQNYIKSIEQ